MYDSDSQYYKDMFEAFVEMSNATDELGVSQGMRKAFNAIEGIASQNFDRVTRDLRNRVSENVHDTAVIAAGGE